MSLIIRKASEGECGGLPDRSQMCRGEASSPGLDCAPIRKSLKIRLRLKKRRISMCSGIRALDEQDHNIDHNIEQNNASRIKFRHSWNDDPKKESKLSFTRICSVFIVKIELGFIFLSCLNNRCRIGGEVKVEVIIPSK